MPIQRLYCTLSFGGERLESMPGNIEIPAFHRAG
jgi:hypothetical protein